MHRFFYSSYNRLKQRRTLFFIFVIGVLIAQIFVATRIHFNEDVSRFIPKNSENKILQKVLAATNFNDNIIVLISKEAAVETAELTEFAEVFLDSLNIDSSNYIESIQGYVEDENALAILDFSYQHAPLFLNETDYKLISEKLSKDSLREITKSNYKSIISPSGIISRDLILKDPLKISLLALQNLNPLGFKDDFVLKNGFLVTKDEKNLLLFITPKADESSKVSVEKLTENLRNVQTELNKGSNKNISIEYYGGPIIADGNATQIKTDIGLTVGIALTLLMLLFIVFYRNIGIPIILLIPTIFGGLLGICVLYVIRDQVSAISLGIGSILLGVTLDYALHILTHIRNGSSIQNLYLDISKPILMSSLTTALAFLCLLFVDSQALQDLGIFASVSVVGASIFALIFIPQAYRPNLEISKASITPKNTFLDKIADYRFHNNKFMLLILVILMVVSVFTYNKVGFNHDLSSLNYMNTELKQTENRLDAITNVSDKSLYLSAYGNNFEDVLQTNDTVYEILLNLEKSNTIKSFNSLSTYLKSEKFQNEKINRWKDFWNLEIIDSTRLNLIEAGKEYGFKEDAFQQFYEYLNSVIRPVNRTDFVELGSFQLENFYATTNDFSTATTVVKVDESQIENLKSAFAKLENTLVIDRQEINENLLGNLKNDFNHLILYCSLAVIILIFLFYRNVKLTLVTVLPILITWLVTIGIMGLLDLEFNIFNIIISSFIFGLGVDYSIFITNGMLNNVDNSTMALRTNKTSILLSVLSTIMGIGVMIFAKHPALHSIALISIIGILTAMIIAFTIQPLLFNLMIRTRNGKN
ncbi:hypothetical protein SAMN03097699_2559 [Flavobacteriaceae bacterium MAR_2010_188]|nr:hypothetical protein SAMN03097699_2559 [Flavobacteriaceae bacterium MAR_2010_188]